MSTTRKPRISDEYLDSFAKSLVLMSRNYRVKLTADMIHHIGAGLGLSKRRRNYLYSAYCVQSDRLTLDKFLREMRAKREASLTEAPAYSPLRSAYSGGSIQIIQRLQQDAPRWSTERITVEQRLDGEQYYAVVLRHRIAGTIWNMLFSLDGNAINNYPPGWPE